MRGIEPFRRVIDSIDSISFDFSCSQRQQAKFRNGLLKKGYNKNKKKLIYDPF